MSKSTLDKMIEAGEFAITYAGHDCPDDSQYRDKRVLESLEIFAFRDGVLIGLAIAGQRSVTLDTGLPCAQCGEKLRFTLSGKNLKATPECSYPKGVPLPFQTIVDVPSGKLAFADRFEFLEEPAKHANLASMSMLAAKLQFEAWADTGFPLAGCGKSNPRVYRKHNHLLISSCKDVIPEGYSETTAITTDYSSWQCGDFERLREVAQVEGEELDTRRVVEVQAGQYRVNVHSIHSDHKGPLFASIELIES